MKSKLLDFDNLIEEKHILITSKLNAHESNFTSMLKSHEEKINH